MTLGLARTGTTGSHFSGDLFLAESVANPGAFTPGFRTCCTRASRPLRRAHVHPVGFMDSFYAAVVQATEEAVVNALVGEPGGGRLPRPPDTALPRDPVVAALRERGVIG